MAQQRTLTLVDRIFTRVKDWQVLVILLAFALFTSFTSNQFIGLNGASNFNGWWEGFWQNFSTEIYGAVLTFFLIEIVVGARESKQAEDLQRSIAEDTREQLRKFMQGQAIARLFAAETLEERRPMLTEMKRSDLLREADLNNANLQGAVLERANLQGAVLERANLQGAKLNNANLQEAKLRDANLEGARLQDANLQGGNLQNANLARGFFLRSNLKEAWLMDADMQGADLRDANLEGATLLETNLEAANMKGANLKDVHMKGYLRRESGELIITDLSREEVERKSAPLVTFELVDPRFSVSTILPDGTNWTPDTDMARFTDPDHPKFWQGYDVAGRDLRERNFSSANLQGAKLNKANLQGANLNKANLQEANLWEANLQGARHLTCEQLGQAASLEGAALPDGTQLPDDDTWRAAFDEWCQTVETDDGDIVPAALDDDADAGE